MWTISVWGLPLISASVWLLTLLTLLGYWTSLGRPVYSYIYKGQTIPFISDVAAQEMQPVFLVGSLISSILLNISLVLIFKSRSANKPPVKLRWKSHGLSQTWSYYLSIFLTAAGSVGLVLLARFDRLQYPGLHRSFLTLYVGAFSLGGAVACLQALRSCMRSGWRHQLLIATFIMRLCTGVVAALLGLGFWYAWVHTELTRDICAIIEWVLGITFTGHVACFAFDLMPSALAIHEGEYVELV